MSLWQMGAQCLPNICVFLPNSWSERQEEIGKNGGGGESQNNVASLPTIQLAKSLAGKLPSQQNLNNKHYV